MKSRLAKAIDELQAALNPDAKPQPPAVAVPEPTECEKVAALIYALQAWYSTNCPIA